MSEKQPRYIDTNDALSLQIDNNTGDKFALGWNRALAKVATELPTADVAPVIHGHWCLEEETFSCSNCDTVFFCGFNTKRENEIRLRECYKFCPVCGAKMEVEDNNND